MTSFERTLLDLIAEFPSHGLEDLDNAKLMNRVDTKFVVPKECVVPLFQKLSDEYSVLQINNNRIFRYQSTYFDTDDYSLYHLHHNKRLNRHKVRLRHYVDSETYFLEVKFKNNKKRTLKTRIGVDSHGTFDINRYQSFLENAGLPKNTVLTPCLVSQYKRIALASEARSERLTLDFELQKHNIVGGIARPVKLEGTVIAELKQARLNRHSPFFKIARELNLRPTSFSKYCIGMALTMLDNEEIKSNRFKPITRRVSIATL